MLEKNRILIAGRLKIGSSSYRRRNSSSLCRRSIWWNWRLFSRPRSFDSSSSSLIGWRGASVLNLRTNANSFNWEISSDKVDQLLRENERSVVVSQAKCIPSESWLFGIFDGHAGESCSRMVSRRLFDYISASVLPKHIKHRDVPLERRLQWLYTSGELEQSDLYKWAHAKNLNRYNALFNEKINTREVSTVREALQLAFLTLDEDLSSDALPDDRGRVIRPLASVVSAGSCACVVHIRGPHLHVANVGDSAAVMGVKSSNGHGLTARRLTVDHTIENGSEVERIRKEHPARELHTVLKGGRLLGQLFPLRAFGDVRYKWSADLQKIVLSPIFNYGLPPNLETPPYLTANPDVFYHRLTPNDKFLVLASDGLWECLNSDRVVRFLADHAVGAETLEQFVPGEGASVEQVNKCHS